MAGRSTTRSMAATRACRPPGRVAVQDRSSCSTADPRRLRWFRPRQSRTPDGTRSASMIRAGRAEPPGSATNRIPADYDGLIGLPITGMKGVNRSAFIRVPFQIADEAALASIGTLTLNMRYDDGFIAYLNGVEVAAVNGPATSAELGFRGFCEPRGCPRDRLRCLRHQRARRRAAGRRKPSRDPRPERHSRQQ